MVNARGERERERERKEEVDHPNGGKRYGSGSSRRAYVPSPSSTRGRLPAEASDRLDAPLCPDRVRPTMTTPTGFISVVTGGDAYKR